MNTYLFDFDGTLVDSMPVYAAMMLSAASSAFAVLGSGCSCFAASPSHA